ncbi:hypothetical protein MHYP_G00334290 [Metynnis hypsauchen]
MCAHKQREFDSEDSGQVCGTIWKRERKRVSALGSPEGKRARISEEADSEEMHLSAVIWKMPQWPLSGMAGVKRLWTSLSGDHACASSRNPAGLPLLW